MKMLKLTLSSIALLLLTTLVISPALNVYAGQCGGVETVILNCDSQYQGDGTSGDVKDTGIIGILVIFIRILTAGVGIAAVGGIAYGAVLYSSAHDNQSQVQKAIATIRNVVIGLIAYAAMVTFLNFIIPGGVL